MNQTLKIARRRGRGSPRAPRLRVLSAMLSLFAVAFPAAGAARADGAGHAYARARLIVGYRPPVASAVDEIRSRTALRVTPVAAAAPTATEQVIALPLSQSVTAAAAQIRQVPGVTYAVPDYLAHAAGSWIPNDRGRTRRAGGWQKLQWNFLAGAGINAPQAWSNLIAEHHRGASGVRIAILDTGVAFEHWRRFHRSPDFKGTRFVAPCDLVAGSWANGRCTNRHPLDREGHGTFVAGVLAESTNNRVGLTGLAYRASIMPVRILDASGLGEETTIAQGIRYAVQHGAQVINLSLEFYVGVTGSEIPDIIAAIRYAHDHGVVVVAAAGNDGSSELAYPARAPSVISVGATTRDRCLASYSDVGQGLALVAPGGGRDRSMRHDRNCHPGRNLPDVFQMTFNNPSHPDRFSLPGGWYGTSMAAPEVSAAAAMVIAGGVIGPHPTPDAVLARLEQTASPLGTGTPNPDYGYGLLNIGAATARGTA